MMRQTMKHSTMLLALTMVLLTGVLTGTLAQAGCFDQSISSEGLVITKIAADSPWSAQQPGQPMQPGQMQPMQPMQPGQMQPGQMQPGPVSPIDGFWVTMTQQGPMMMGLQNGMFMMMGPNMQVLGQGTFVIQGQQIISTGADGQKVTLDFQSDGMNLQLRDPQSGGVMHYQKMPAQPYGGQQGGMPYGGQQGGMPQGQPTWQQMPSMPQQQ